MCVDDDQMYVMGDPFAWSRQANIQIDFYKTPTECDEVDYENEEEPCENLDDLEG